MKLFYILDGLGDTCRPSPLKLAQTPNFDIQQKTSTIYKFIAIKHIAPTSDQAFSQFLDINVPTRGVLEALGDGHIIYPGQTAFKCIFAQTLDNIVINRHPEISSQNGFQLVQLLNKIKNIKIIHQKKHRFSLVYDEVTDYENDPQHDNFPLLASSDQKFYQVQQKIDQILADSQLACSLNVNTVLFRAPGQIKKVQQTFSHNYVFFTDSEVIFGLAKSINADVYYWKEINYLAVIQQYKEYNVIFHFDGTDQASHQGDLALKIKEIENADFIFGQIMSQVDVERFCVFGDHCTPCSEKIHSADYVPLMLSIGKGCQFNDESCESNEIKEVVGNQILLLMGVQAQ